MAKETYYFPHDYNTSGDPKIGAMLGDWGAVGYGLFWRIIEMLHDNKDHTIDCKKYIYNAIAGQMSGNNSKVKFKITTDVIASFLKSCIDDYELLASDGVKIWSARVYKNIRKMEEISIKRAEAGKIGGLKSKQIEANAKQMQANAKQNEANGSKIKEKKIKENKEDIEINLFPRFWDLYAKKNDLAKCQKKWAALSFVDQQLAIAATPAYVQSTPDPKYRKNPLTWLNGQCWLDYSETTIENTKTVKPLENNNW